MVDGRRNYIDFSSFKYLKKYLWIGQPDQILGFDF